MKVLSLGLAVTQGNTEVKTEQNKTNKQQQQKPLLHEHVKWDLKLTL